VHRSFIVGISKSMYNFKSKLSSLNFFCSDTGLKTASFLMSQRSSAARLYGRVIIVLQGAFFRYLLKVIGSIKSILKGLLVNPNYSTTNYSTTNPSLGLALLFVAGDSGVPPTPSLLSIAGILALATKVFNYVTSGGLCFSHLPVEGRVGPLHGFGSSLLEELEKEDRGFHSRFLKSGVSPELNTWLLNNTSPKWGKVYAYTTTTPPRELLPSYTNLFSNDGRDEFSLHHEGELSKIREAVNTPTRGVYSKRITSFRVPPQYKFTTHMWDLASRGVISVTKGGGPLVAYHPGPYCRGAGLAEDLTWTWQMSAHCNANPGVRFPTVAPEFSIKDQLEVVLSISPDGPFSNFVDDYLNKLGSRSNTISDDVQMKSFIKDYVKNLDLEKELEETWGGDRIALDFGRSRYARRCIIESGNGSSQQRYGDLP
jgi:hypothetical protein